MSDKKYIKSTNNFVRDNSHIKTVNENIFERDGFLIHSMGLSPRGSKRIYGVNNFKMSPKGDLHVYDKKRYSNFLSNNCSPDIIVDFYVELDSQEKDSNKLYYVRDNDRFYDWDDNLLKFVISKKNKIFKSSCYKSNKNSLDNFFIKPDNQNIQSLAYYGSSSELFRTTINDIIKTFPAEIHLPVGDESVYYYYDDDGNESVVNNNNIVLHEAKNPFAIDVRTPLMITKVDNYNRYFCYSIDNYVLLDNNGDEIDDEIIWTGLINNTTKKCYNNGELMYIIPLTSNINLYYYYIDGEEVLFHDSDVELHVRLNQDEITKIFNGYTDWLTQNLLNRYSVPKYTSIFKVNTDNEDANNGISIKYNRFTWPIDSGDWNIDISSRDYVVFISDIQSILNNYDNKYTDNLWRMLCHESIKKIDSQSLNLNGETDSSILDGYNKFKDIINIYGRQLDELKLYIDNIKFAHTVSYDSLNNAPDYMLSDLLETKGWEFNNIDIYDGIGNDEPIYDGWTYNYDDKDLNILILKQLVLCGNYIQRCKGTKKAIDMLMSLFGLKHSQYKIDEFVNVAVDGYNNYDGIIKYNNYFNSYVYDITTDGLLCSEVELTDDSGGTISKYVIPWYPNNKKLDNSLYFQMRGGWGESAIKNINSDISEQIDKVHRKLDYFKDNAREFRLYDDSSYNIKYINNISDLTKIPDDILYENVMYYVENISNIGKLYNNIRAGFTPSHYFILRDVNNKSIIGSKTNESGYGWQVVYQEFLNGQKDIEDALDVSGDTQNANRIVFFESVSTSINGNNPHFGYLKYDSGKEYLDNYRQLFKYNVDNYDLSKLTIDEQNELKNIGFTLTEYVDNKKTWWFYNKLSESEPLKIRSGTTVIDDIDVKCGSESDYKISVDINNYDISQYTEFSSGNTNIRDTNLIPYNPESGETTNDEIASTSIINNKKLIISTRNKSDKDLTNYLVNKVIPFIKQLIPSTTLVEYDFYQNLVANKGKIIITEQYTEDILLIWSPSGIKNISSVNDMTNITEQISVIDDVYQFSVSKKDGITGGNDTLYIENNDGGLITTEINYLYINTVE